MANLICAQEAARKKKEAAKKKELDALNGRGNLAEGASAGRADVAKDIKKTHELAIKEFRRGAMDYARKRKSEKNGPATPPNNKTKKIKTAQKAKAPKKNAPKQGGRKVPVPGDMHGCGHSGLLELLPLERKYLQTYVKEGGWLYKTPCYDCAKSEGGGKKPVLDVSDLLNGKGMGELGVYCNCGPVGHNMDEDEEPIRKQQWACNMVLCMDCFNRRKTGMGGTNGEGKRTRRQKNWIGK